MHREIQRRLQWMLPYEKRGMQAWYVVVAAPLSVKWSSNLIVK